MKKLAVSLLLFSLVISSFGGTAFAQTSSKKISAPVSSETSVEAPSVPSTALSATSESSEKNSLNSQIEAPVVPAIKNDIPLPAEVLPADVGNNADIPVIDEEEPLRDPAEPEDGMGEIPSDSSTRESSQPYDFRKNFTGNFETDLFTGAATFHYPLWVPAGRLGMTPTISLSYSTNDNRFDSFAGYGWSFPTNAIYRSTRRGSDKIFSRNDFTADINGSAQELVVLDEDTGLYGAKIESSFVKYEFSDNRWIVTDGRGARYIFGASENSRQIDPDDAARVYKWLLERVEDLNGNFISYSYFHDRGQVYPATIRYTGHGNEPGIFGIRFIRQERPGVVSYERGFKTETRFIIERVGVYSYQTGQPAEVLSYYFNHEARNNVIRLLNRIEVRSGRDGSVLPPIAFSYYNGGENEPLKKINYLKEINFPYGARQEFFYKPSTAQRLGNGALASKLPFAVFALAESRLYPAPNAAAQISRYEYEGGHYYFDQLDAYKKEYAGFHTVTVTDPTGNIKKLYFHQSEFSADNETSAAQGEFQDHISKKGRIYREEQYDDAGHLFQKTIRAWDKMALPDDNVDIERFFVSLRQEVTADYDGDGDNRSRASSYQYDAYGNVIRRTDFGEVALVNERGEFQDINQDRTETITEYAINQDRHIVSLPFRAVRKDFLINIIGEEKVYYDNSGLGQVTQGNQTRHETRILADGDNPDLIWAVSEKEYDAYGLPVRSINPRGFETRTMHGQWHLYPASVVNALGQITTYAYDVVFGIPVSMTDSNGGRQTTVLDGLGRKINQSVSNPNGGPDVMTTSYSYQLENYPRSIQVSRHLFPAASIVDQRTYLDGLGREIQTRSKMEEANQYSVANKFYDARGNLLKETLPVFNNGIAFTPQNMNSVGNLYSYDALNRVISIANPLGETRTTYDQWEQTMTDPNGNRKDLIFDALGRLTGVREYLDNVAYATNYKYNSNGDLTKITNAKGEIANFGYDLAGRKVRGEDFHQPIDQSFAIWQYSYDKNGNNVSLVKPDGEEIAFVYDALDRILSENDEISYVYDQGNNSIGRLASVSFPSGSKSFSYDRLGRVINQQLSVNLGEEAEDFALSYSYDIQGNVLAMTYSNGIAVRNVYNNGGLLESVFVREPEQEERAVVTATKYLPNGFVGTRDFANGISAMDQYPIGQMYRLVRRTTRRLADNTNLQDIAYSYDAVGNITRIVDSSATNAAKTANYQYDDLYRLTRVEITNAANNENYIQTFGYDITGNILSFSPQAHPYEYAGANGVGGENFSSPQAVTRIGDLNFVYDRNGNLAEQRDLAGRWIHAWDWKDRLVSSIHSVPDPAEEWRNDQEIRYSYDEQKQRILKNDITNGEITVYVDKYFDKEGDTEKAYVYAGDVKVASLESETGLVFHHSDHLTGANVDTDTDGQVIQILDYFPYGQTRIDESQGEYHDDYQFTGKELDEETRLNYFEARYYDSAIGRFISRDTWDGDLKDPQSLNKYSYVRNNPLKLVDPDGQSFQTFMQGTVSPLTYAYNHPFQTLGVVAATTIAAAAAPVAVAIGGAALGAYAIGNSAYQAYKAPDADTRDYYLGQGFSAAALTVSGIKAAGVAGKSLVESESSVVGKSVGADSVYSRAAEHAMEKGRFSDLSKSEVENIAKQTKENADISGRIQGTYPGTNNPVDKQYYGNLETGNVFINTNIGSPTIFQNKNPIQYIRKHLFEDLDRFGRR